MDVESYVVLYLSVFLLCCFSEVYLKRVPPYITLCSRHERDMNSCILRAIEQLRPYLKNGIPELYVPNLNPLRVVEVELKNADSLSASFKNLEIHNAYNFEIKGIDVQLENNYLELELHFPFIRIDSQYSIHGKMLFLELDGSGNATGNYTEVYSNSAIQGVRKIRKGHEYIKFNDTKLDLKIGHAVLYFDNIFKDNKELTRQVNIAINKDSEALIDELYPVIHEAASKIIFGLLAEIFWRIPLDSLFAD